MNQCVAYCGGMDPKDFSVTTKLFPDAKRDAYQNYGKTFRAVSNWKADYKRRKEMAKKNHEMGIVEQSWQVVSKQKWDEIAKTWVITTLKAPADQVSTDVIDKLGLKE